MPRQLSRKKESLKSWLSTMSAIVATMPSLEATQTVPWKESKRRCRINKRRWFAETAHWETKESVKSTSAPNMASPLSSSNVTNAVLWRPITVQETHTFAPIASKILDVWTSSTATGMSGSAHSAGGMPIVTLFLWHLALSVIAKESEFGQDHQELTSKDWKKKPKNIQTGWPKTLSQIGSWVDQTRRRQGVCQSSANQSRLSVLLLNKKRGLIFKTGLLQRIKEEPRVQKGPNLQFDLSWFHSEALSDLKR